MRRLIIRAAQTLALTTATLIAFLAYLHVSGNFHAVSAGQVYRAAQLSPEQLARWQAQHGIASVLNLRGENAGRDWYDAEVAASQNLGLTHIDFRMSAGKALRGPEALRLIEVMRDAPKPLLIHCQAGSDRTGLASALYVAGIEGGSEAAAEWQLSLRYGHFGIPWLSAAYPMDETWEQIEPWLGFES